MEQLQLWATAGRSSRSTSNRVQQ